MREKIALATSRGRFTATAFRCWGRALPVRARGVAAFLCALWLVFGPAPAPAQGIRLGGPPAQVNDGDTFEADLNGNGRLDLPQERIRLLYVDAPELHESRKGQDLKNGLPARAFLRAALRNTTIEVFRPGNRKYDNFGRSLAVVKAGGLVVNLELVRRGHGYFDTRFRFPRDYGAYAAAEGAAFAARRGIWRDPATREAYLKRLRKEGKTPRAKSNPLFGGRHRAGNFFPEKWVGRFVRLRGRLAGRKVLRRGARILFLRGPKGREPLSVYVPRRTAEKLPVDGWPLEMEIELDGFIQIYRKTPQLKLHYGGPAPAESST